MTEGQRGSSHSRRARLVAFPIRKKIQVVLNQKGQFKCPNDDYENRDTGVGESNGVDG